jgi:hypothetical protein
MKNISKIQFENMKKKSMDFHTQKRLFDAKVKKIYGKHYSDFDYDLIIDAIDYGQGNISYECFCELMQNIVNGNNTEKYCSILKKYGI